MVALLLFTTENAWSQGAVQQSGPVVPSDIAVWGGNGIIQDGGPPGGGNSPAGPLYSTQYDNFGVFGASGPGTSGQVLTSNGSSSPPSFANPSNIYTAGTGLNLTGQVFSLQVPVPVPLGGSGDTSLTAGGVLYGAGTSPLGVTAAGSTGAPFVGGTAPSFTSGLTIGSGKITGTLANGSNVIAGFAEYETVYIADNFGQATETANINAAFTACGVNRCEVVVNGTGGTTFNVSRISVPNHDLLYFLPGSYTATIGGFETGQGAKIACAGRDVTVFTISSNPADGKGFWLLDGGGSTAFTYASDNAGTLENCKTTYVQADTSSRGSLTTYKPAIDVRQARSVIQDVAITEATIGIDLSGQGTATINANGEGAYIRDVEMSAYTTGVLLDGDTDTIRLEGVHFWPFDLTGNQATIFDTSGTTALLCGRSDDTDVNGFLNLGYQALHTFHGSLTGVTGNCVMKISNSDLEGNGILSATGMLYITNTEFEENLAITKGWINNTGASIQISNSTFNDFSSGGCDPCVYTNASNLQISNSTFNSATAVDETWLKVDTGGLLIANDNFFNRQSSASGTYTKQTILQVAGRLSAHGNRSSDLASMATGTFIKVTADDWNDVSGNMGVGWATVFPTPSASAVGRYYNNGSNCTGQGTLSGGTLAISASCVTSHSIIVLQDTTAAAAMYPSSVTGGGFTANGTSADTFNWYTVNQGQ